jgi:hypothetical protein
VRRRIGWLGAAVIVCCVAVAAPALAGAESLAISFGAKPTLGGPLSITAKGVADGTHRLYAYADQSGYSCAPDPYDEYNRSSVVALSSTTGDPLSTGSYSKSYSYTPRAELFRICAYLDDTLSDTPDAFATNSASEAPIKEYLENQTPAQPTGTWEGPQAPGAVPPIVTSTGMREYWERVTREAKGTPEREHAEHEAQKAQRTITTGCVVPSLKGDSLRRARRALRHAHCKLGRVSTDRRAHGALVVIRQSPTRGMTVDRGAAVAVTLASRKR